MRKNLPVTNVEHLLGDDTLIVSRTDTKGRIVFFNDQFVAASGFTEAELMNQPHNIVRHPEMPPEAFEDLWVTAQAGKPWVGAVKNRRKNGGNLQTISNPPLARSSKRCRRLRPSWKLPQVR